MCVPRPILVGEAGVGESPTSNEGRRLNLFSSDHRRLNSLFSARTELRVPGSAGGMPTYHGLSTKSFLVCTSLIVVRLKLTWYVTTFSSRNSLPSARNETIETIPTMSRLTPVIEIRRLCRRILNIPFPDAIHRQTSARRAATRIQLIDNSVAPQMSTPTQTGVPRHLARILLA